MARISILMLPEPGHFLPTLRVANALKGMGHNVCYLSVPQFQEFFHRQGFEFRPILAHLACGKSCEDVFSVQETGGEFHRKLATIQWDVIDLIVNALTLAKTDLFICDSVVSRPIGGAATRTLGIQVVQFSTSLPESNEIAFPEMVLCPQEFEIPETVGENPLRVYGEASIFRNRPRTQFPWPMIDPQKPLVYCNFGTQSSEYQGAGEALEAIVKGFSAMPQYQLVIAAGWANDRLAKLAGSAGNVVVVPTAPQLELLEHASLSITHGGLGGVKEAILAQVPMIVVPFLYDQPANARRVAHHGLGYVCLPEHCRPEHVRELVTQAMENPDVRSNMRKMSSAFVKQESRSLAAHFVDSFVERGHSPTEPGSQLESN